MVGEEEGRKTERFNFESLGFRLSPDSRARINESFLIYSGANLQMKLLKIKSTAHLSNA